MIQLGLLGPLVARVDGHDVPLAGAMRRAVLLRLAIVPDEVVTTGLLIEDVWSGRPPPGAATTLRSHLRHLREVLGAGCIRHVPGGYLLDAAGCGIELDAARFEAEVVAAGAARRGDRVEEAERHLVAALGRWRGEPLVDVAGEPWAVGVATRLAEARLAAVEARIDCLLALGRHADAVAAAEEALGSDPARERTWAQLMLGLYRSQRQAEALRAFQRARDHLAEELGLEPSPELVRLERSIVLRDPGLDLPATAAVAARGLPPGDAPRRALPGGLPERRSSFVGRVAEVRHLRGLLDAHRLVTLVGAGGCGKTRLAAELAAALAERGPALVRWVPLAPVRDPGAAAAAVGRALEVPPEGGDALAEVVAALGAEPWLLVLDNCEHLLDASRELIGGLLGACPGVRVLVTCRQPLGGAGEVVHRVPSLTVPAAGAADLVEIGRSEAVQLVVDRVLPHDPGFRLGAPDAAVLARICRRLDGLPLALELVAARLRTMSLTEIEAQLDDRFRLLRDEGLRRPPRQQTLRALLDWSFDLLDDEQRHVLRQLSVFVGGFEVAGAAAVCAGRHLDGRRVLELLSALVDRSLLVARRRDGPDALRYELLETVRAYAGERLAETGAEEVTAARSRHARALVDLAEALAAAGDEHQRLGLVRLDDELDNLRVGLAHLLDTRDADGCVRLVGALWWYWLARGRYREGLAATAAVLDLLEPGSPRRPEVLLACAQLHTRRGDLGAAQLACQEALRIARPLGSPTMTAELCLLAATAGREDAAAAVELLAEALDLATAAGAEGLVARILIERAYFPGPGGPAAARADLGRALAIIRAHGDTTRVAQLLNNLGILALQDGDLAAASTHFQEARLLARSLRCDSYARLFTLNLGVVALRRGRPGDAARAFATVLEEAVEAEEQAQVAYALLGVALCGGPDPGDDERCAILHGAAEAMITGLGQRFEAVEAALRDRDVAARSLRMGRGAFDAAWSVGRHLGADRALELARAVRPARPLPA